MRPRSRGFVLVYVILLVCMVGLFMTVLTGGTNSMIGQTNKAQVRAIQRNLQLSGMAWAARHSSKRGETPEATGQVAANSIETAQTVQLDAMSLSTRPAQLTIVISGTAKGRPVSVQISTSCTYGTQTVHQTTTYALDQCPQSAESRVQVNR